MKRGFSENKFNKNTNRKSGMGVEKKMFKNNSNIKYPKAKTNINTANKWDREKKEENEIPKSIYNIDLFTGVKEEFEKEKSNGSNNNIYLNFYNKHTKNQVLQKESALTQKYFNNNIELIKEKQEKYKLKKEEEEKIRKQKEREDTNEYRKEQMIKLYKMENVYKKEIMKRKKLNQNRNKKLTEKITLVARNKNEIKKDAGDKSAKAIKMTRREYEKKLDFLVRQTRLHINELERLPIANKTNKVYQKENQLNKNINELQKTIEKYQNKIGIVIIDE